MALNRFGYTLAEVQREHILETLTRCDGNRTRAAKFLEISLRCLRMKLHQFGHSGSTAPGPDFDSRADLLRSVMAQERMAAASLEFGRRGHSPA